jgi:hypothetical protein
MKKLLVLLAVATLALPLPAAPVTAQDIKALIEANRATLTTLISQRKELIEKLKNASAQDKEAARNELKQLIKDNHDSQREIAKTVREAMKARRLAPKG